MQTGRCVGLHRRAKQIMMCCIQEAKNLLFMKCLFLRNSRDCYKMKRCPKTLICSTIRNVCFRFLMVPGQVGKNKYLPSGYELYCLFEFYSVLTVAGYVCLQIDPVTFCFFVANYVFLLFFVYDDLVEWLLYVNP
jgi:hypothetical protein